MELHFVYKIMHLFHVLLLLNFEFIMKPKDYLILDGVFVTLSIWNFSSTVFVYYIVFLCLFHKFLILYDARKIIIF
ncbi:hypothetical protein C1645_774801 [Glomus cerebriforme]|uniref:Uncharacterized protein n=1 Tax=Glomus cerebriforme TaxID=658196 RepID=A0A397SV56_9GLOM|nr:hypothetical protein C1645_774801 [Glomus cerebriforme]